MPAARWWKEYRFACAKQVWDKRKELDFGHRACGGVSRLQKTHDEANTIWPRIKKKLGDAVAPSSIAVLNNNIEKVLTQDREEEKYDVSPVHV